MRSLPGWRRCWARESAWPSRKDCRIPARSPIAAIPRRAVRSLAWGTSTGGILDALRFLIPGSAAAIIMIAFELGMARSTTRDRAHNESTYQGESRMLDSSEGVCAGQVGLEFPATSVPFSNWLNFLRCHGQPPRSDPAHLVGVHGWAVGWLGWCGVAACLGRRPWRHPRASPGRAPVSEFDESSWVGGRGVASRAGPGGSPAPPGRPG
jgi:hypothetical protein